MPREITSAARPRHGYFHSLNTADERKFCALIAALRTPYRYVSYTEACDETNQNEPVFAWSVDDGFISAIRAGEIFADQGISACFFVSPVLLSGQHSTIPEYFRSAHDVEPEVLGWSHAERLLELGHEIGSHSMLHRDMSTLGPAELEHELYESKSALEARLGPIRHFAWPYGRFGHFSAEALDLAVAAGYETVASGERSRAKPTGGWSQHCVRRDLLDPSWPARHSLYFAMN